MHDAIQTVWHFGSWLHLSGFIDFGLSAVAIPAHRSEKGGDIPPADTNARLINLTQVLDRATARPAIGLVGKRRGQLARS
jgi:hypothetical protein